MIREKYEVIWSKMINFPTQYVKISRFYNTFPFKYKYKLLEIEWIVLEPWRFVCQFLQQSNNQTLCHITK